MQILSNRHKHRHLAQLGIQISRAFRVSGPPDESTDAEPNTVAQIEQVHRGDMTLQLLVKGGGDAIGTLEEIQIGTYELLMSFEDDFRFRQLRGTEEGM